MTYSFLPTIILIFLILGFLSYVAWEKYKTKKFYEDVWWLFPLGIYVWGDALILLPFWLGVTGYIWKLVSLKTINIVNIAAAQAILWKIFLVFHLIRSFFEIIYWLNHQSAKDKFVSPFFRKNKLLNHKSTAILHQLIHTVIVVITLLLLKVF